MKEIFAFGSRVPEEVINELISEYGKEQVTSEFIETLYEYEFRDNN